MAHPRTASRFPVGLLGIVLGLSSLGCGTGSDPRASQPSPVPLAGAGPATAPSWTPLHSEVVYPEDDDPDQPSIGGEIHYPDPSLAEHFLAKGMPVNATDDKGRTGLFVAVRHDRKAVAEVFLKHGADVNAGIVPTRFTPLMMAAGSGYDEMAQMLIAHKADVSAADADGNTALHFASALYPTIVRLLVKHGADVKARNAEGLSAIGCVRQIMIGDKGYTQEQKDAMIALLRELGAPD